MALVAGTRLGTYEVVSLLGAGGMGEVYRARDTRLGREVALKVLPRELASSTDRLARFEREARTVAGLNHPNIVTLFSVEDEDGVRFLTMELVEGERLDRLVRPGGLPLPRLLDVAIPLAEALVAAHERGVVHRDLKPGNVMVTGEGRVKVLDFGLAKLAEGGAQGAGEAALSLVGEVVGTVPYMAPEQLRGEAVDARADLFSLGVVLYELATGVRPFGGGSAAEVMSAILNAEPEPLGRLRGDLSRDLERILERCLEKEPRERVQTARDVYNELRRVGREVERSVAGAVPSPKMSGPSPASSPPLAAAPAATLGAAPPREVPSIAVLPFVNRSRDEEDEYFSDGLADELLNVLTKIRGLRVAARSSAFQFKGKSEDLAMIGQKLHVATILEGSVRKAGSRVRISVQLVKVADGYHLWSETYDRTLEDIFAVQDEIAQSVVQELRTTLLGEEADSKANREARAEVARAAKGRGENPEAHNLYLQGRHLVDRLTREDVAKGIEYLKQALELDPGNALAWAEVARACSIEAGQGWIPSAEGYGRAREAVERALSLEQDLAEGHARMGRILMSYDWDWESAERSLRRALELAPGNAGVLNAAGTLAQSLGRHEEAVALFRRAVEQSPLGASVHHNLGTALHSADRPAEAEQAFRKALELAPQRVGTRAQLALALLELDHDQEALAEAIQEPDEAIRLWALAILHHTAGSKAESDAALGELTEKHGETMAFQIASVRAVRGEVDHAFEWLERAYTQRDPGLSETKATPQLLPLHGDPRWKPFLKKMGFEE